MRKCRKSARKTSCNTCKLLYQIVQHFHAEGQDSIYIDHFDDDEGTVEVSILADLDEDDVILDLFVPQGEESGHPLIRSSSKVRTVLRSSGDDESIEKINAWIKECCEEHNNCEIEVTQLPTRVIDVGLDGEEPFLFETGRVREQYVTLSYVSRFRLC